MDANGFRTGRTAALLTIAAVAASVLAVGCGSDSSDEPAREPAGTTATTDGSTGTAGSSAPETDDTATTGQKGSMEGTSSDGTIARDGSWRLGNAGTVDFTATGGQLELVSATARPGWGKRIADDRADEIEVHFTRRSTDWKFEAELDDGRLEITREQEDRQAQPGTFAVGDAARATIALQGSRLVLRNVASRQGWTETKRDIESDELELDFRRGRETAELEAELRGGNLRVEITLKVTGPIPG